MATIAQGGNSAIVSAGGALKVDGSAVTQPISGTVTANAGSGTFTISGTVTANAGSGTFTVGGTVTANIGTSGSLALDATLTGRTQKSQITDGTRDGTVKAASTAAIATDTAVVVAISPNNTVAATQSGTWTVQPGNTPNTTAWKVDGSAVTQPVSGTFWQGTQPVSGTVTANAGTNLNTSALALDTSVSGILVAQGSTTSGETGPLIQGAVTTAAPSYTTAKTSPLSLTTTGLLRTDGSGVTQPVSGTVTANIGTSGSLALDATVAKLTITQGTALGSNTQALMGGSVLTAAPSYTTGQISPLSLTTTGLLRVDGSGVTQPVSGTVTANAGSGTFTVSGTVTANAGTNLNTSALALDATVAKLTLAQASTTSGQTGALILGAVTTAAPSYTTAQSNPLSLTIAGALRTDASATTQPISGTVTANQGGTWTVQPGNTPNTTAWKVDGSAVTQPISGTVTANAGTNLNTSSLVLDATAAKLNLAQGSTTSAQTGPLIQGAVTTAAPSYTTAQTSPLSLTTGGLLRIDGSGVTQPVSGTVTANAGTNLNTSLLLLDSTFTGRINTQGQKAMAASTPVTLASDQSALATTSSASTNRIGGAYEVGGQVIDEVPTVRSINRAFVNATSSGNTAVVVAQGASIRIRVLAVFIMTTTAVSIKFQSAANDVSATYSVAANGGFVMPETTHGWFQTNANEALNINLSGAATNVGCNIIWVQAT